MSLLSRAPLRTVNELNFSWTIPVALEMFVYLANKSNASPSLGSNIKQAKLKYNVLEKKLINIIKT